MIHNPSPWTFTWISTCPFIQQGPIPAGLLSSWSLSACASWTCDVCCAVLSPSEKYGGMSSISGSVQLDQRGNSPGKRVHGEQERGQARRFSLFDMMVAIERGREEGFFQSLLGRAAGSHDVWPHWSWGLSRAGGPLPWHHAQPCRVNPLLSIGWAGKEEPRDHPVTIFNIAVIDLPLSPSLLCPSCHKLYKNQDEAQFQMCVMVSVGSASEELHAQRSAVQKQPETEHRTRNQSGHTDWTQLTSLINKVTAQSARC